MNSYRLSTDNPQPRYKAGVWPPRQKPLHNRLMPTATLYSAQKPKSSTLV